MSTIYKYDKADLYQNTNGGLEILHKYIPECIGCETSSSKKFKSILIREEKTGSSSLFNTGKYWVIKDFGGESYQPIDIVMKITGLEFAAALKQCYAEFGVTANGNAVTNAKLEFKENKENLIESSFSITAKKKETSLGCFGPYVTSEITKRYNVFELESYIRVTKGTVIKTSKIITTTATDNYPIFCYSNNLKKWAKLYQPAEFKRVDNNGKTINYKHGYIGEKDHSYIHGLDRILKDVNEKEIIYLFDQLQNTFYKESKKELFAEIEEAQVKNIIICSGGSDGLNVASLSDDYYPIWFNSESQQITFEQYSRLNKLCNNFYNLPDIDTPGIKYANILANKFWNLKTIQLPKAKMGKNGKDFRDWMKFYSLLNKEGVKIQFEKLLRLALKCNFIDINDQGRDRISVSNLHYFLKTNYYFTYKEAINSVGKSNEDTNFIIKIDDYKVSIPEISEIRNYCIEYLKDKGVSLSVIDLVKSSRAFNLNELKKLPIVTLDFKNYTPTSQYFYFNNGVVCVSKDDIKFSTQNISNKYVWNSKLNAKNFRTTDSFFEFYRDSDNNKRVKINKDNSCDFRGYLINGSRIFWRKELEENFKEKSKKEQEEYHKNNLFNLNGEGLTTEEQIKQENHFLNKCYALGYLLHNYKREDFAKFIYILDNAIKEVSEEANGGTGKSLMIRALKEISKIFYIDGKKPNIEKDHHLLGGVQLEHDLVYIEDGVKGMGLKLLYNQVASDMDVNPKHAQGYVIPFSDSPKMVGSFNYGLDGKDGSDFRRVFYVAFGDYYHSGIDKYKEERKVSDDFGYSFFQDWDDVEYNKFFNFLMQCCQFYLSNMKDEMTAPMDNILVNNLQAQVGDTLITWADKYFSDEANFNTRICRTELYKNYKDDDDVSYALGSGKWKRGLNDYCKLRGYVFNPDHMKDSTKRIRENYYKPGSQNRSTKEVFYIEKNDTQNETQNEFDTSGIDF